MALGAFVTAVEAQATRAVTLQEASRWPRPTTPMSSRPRNLRSAGTGVRAAREPVPAFAQRRQQWRQLVQRGPPAFRPHHQSVDQWQHEEPEPKHRRLERRRSLHRLSPRRGREAANAREEGQARRSMNPWPAPRSKPRAISFRRWPVGSWWRQAGGAWRGPSSGSPSRSPSCRPVPPTWPIRCAPWCSWARRGSISRRGGFARPV